MGVLEETKEENQNYLEKLSFHHKEQGETSFLV